MHLIQVELIRRLHLIHDVQSNDQSLAAGMSGDHRGTSGANGLDKGGQLVFQHIGLTKGQLLKIRSGHQAVGLILSATNQGNFTRGKIHRNIGILLEYSYFSLIFG